MADINLPFASSGPDRRVPDAQELLTGFPCGPADRQLFNFLQWLTGGQVADVIRAAGLTPQDNDLTQLTQAIGILAPFIFQDTAINVSLSGSTNPVNPLAGDAFNSLSGAMEWLRGYRISPNVTVTVQVAAGTYTETGAVVDVSHPDGQQVVITGQTLTGTYPNGSTDLPTATAGPFLATLRTIFPSVIECGIGGLFTGRAGIRLIRNLLVIGPGINEGISVGTTEPFVDATFGGDGPSDCSLMYCWFQNWGDGILARSGSHLNLFHVGSSFNSGNGAVCNNGSYVRGKDVTCSQNGTGGEGSGIIAREDSFIEIEGQSAFDFNNNHGVRLIQAGARLQGTLSEQISVRGNGSVNLSGTEHAELYGRYVNANTQAISDSSATAQNFSNFRLLDCTNLSALSPAAGVQGNVLSFIQDATS